MKKTILASLFSSLLIIGCSDNSKKSEEKSLSEPAKQENATKIEQRAVVQPEQKEEKSLADKAKDMGDSTSKTVQESAKVVMQKTEELAKQAQNSELVQKIAQKTKEGVAALATMATPNNDNHTINKDNIKELFSKCAGCHGNKAQNKALGVSHAIAGWDAKKIENALNGYKTGTYGGSMKNIMKGQVIMLKESDIKALAEYISKL